MKVVRGYLLRKKPSLTLKVLSLKACMLVRELTIHIYINIHSVAVSPRYTHTVIILKDQDRCRKKSEWNGGEEQGRTDQPRRCVGLRLLYGMDSKPYLWLK